MKNLLLRNNGCRIFLAIEMILDNKIVAEIRTNLAMLSIPTPSFSVANDYLICARLISFISISFNSCLSTIPVTVMYFIC